MKVYILLGGNLGDPIAILGKAAQYIEERIGKICQRSSFYETEPVGFVHENNFINQVLVCDTALSPKEALSTCLHIEHLMGRVRTGKGYSARTLDVDMLFYEDLIMDTPELTLPHPRMHQRLFTMTPMAEIAPDFIHPVLEVSCNTILENCPDCSTVVKL